MRAAIAGDESGYRRFLGELASFLRAQARSGLLRAGRSPADAEDIVQETLIAIHTKRQSWRADEPIIPWIRAIARHKLIDALRRRGSSGYIDIDDFAETIADPVAEQEIATRDVIKLAKSLPDGQRLVIQSIFAEGRSTAETAVHLAMTEGAVRVALHRGLARLAVLFKGGF